jgi:hypothetical protein
MTVTSRSKSLKTKTSFPRTKQSACESRSDLLASSTRPTYPKRIVKAERFAFQLPPSFFFLLLRVKASLERLEVPSSSYEDSSSSSSSSGKLNLSLLLVSATMERVRDLIVGPFPIFFPMPLPFPVWPPPLQYYRRSYAVGQIGVGIGMYVRSQRYRKALCPFDVSDISCLSHVRPERQVTFRVFRPEKCIFPRVVRWARQPVSCSVGSAGNCVVGDLPGKPVVNTTILACASISCCCYCIQPFLLLFLYAAFKSYNMLNVYRLCQSRS